MAKNRRPVEVDQILKNLDPAVLESFSSLKNSKYMEPLEDFCRRYAITKRNQILDLSTENERKLANEVSVRKGQVYSLDVLIETIKGASKEISRRGE